MFMQIYDLVVDFGSAPSCRHVHPITDLFLRALLDVLYVELSISIIPIQMSMFTISQLIYSIDQVPVTEFNQ